MRSASSARGLALRDGSRLHGLHLSDSQTVTKRRSSSGASQRQSYAFDRRASRPTASRRMFWFNTHGLKLNSIIHGRIYRSTSRSCGLALLRDLRSNSFNASVEIVRRQNGYLSPVFHRSSGVARRDLNQARRVRQTCVQGTGCATGVKKNPELHQALGRAVRLRYTGEGAPVLNDTQHITGRRYQVS